MCYPNYRMMFLLDMPMLESVIQGLVWNMILVEVRLNMGMPMVIGWLYGSIMIAVSSVISNLLFEFYLFIIYIFCVNMTEWEDLVLDIAVAEALYLVKIHMGYIVVVKAWVMEEVC